MGFAFSRRRKNDETEFRTGDDGVGEGCLNKTLLQVFFELLVLKRARGGVKLTVGGPRAN